MATGDVLNNLKKLKSSLASIKFEMPVSDEELCSGDPKVFLPMIHYVLLRYSKSIAQWVVDNGYELMGKSDSRFMEATYKLMRTEFNYKPTLTLAQFFTTGFGERKLIFLFDLIQLCKIKTTELSKLTEPKKIPFPSLKEVNQRYHNKKNISPVASLPSQSLPPTPPSEISTDSIQEIHEKELGEESFLEEAQAPELATSSVTSTPPPTQEEPEPIPVPTQPETTTTPSPTQVAPVYYEYPPSEYYLYPDGGYEYDYCQYPQSYPSPSYYLPEQYTPLPQYMDMYACPPAMIPRPNSHPSNQTAAIVKEVCTVCCYSESHQIMESIYTRFDSLEAKFDDSLQNMHAKLLVLEGKLKFLEEKQSKSHNDSLSHSTSSVSSLASPYLRVPVVTATQTTPKNSTWTVLKDLTNYSPNTPLLNSLSKKSTSLHTPQIQKKGSPSTERSSLSTTSSPTVSLVSSPFTTSMILTSPQEPGSAPEPQEEGVPSTTFLTAVPEAMIAHPTPSVTILEAQQFIQSISQRFQKTQQLLATP